MTTDGRHNQLQVTWTTHNVHFQPTNQFRYPVSSVEEALLVLTALSDFQMFEQPARYRVPGLEICIDGDWVEFYNDQGQSVRDMMEEPW